MSFEIFGKKKKYEIKNLPEIFRDVAKEIEKKGNPGGIPKYCCEEVEEALEKLGRRLKIFKMDAYIE